MTTIISDSQRAEFEKKVKEQIAERRKMLTKKTDKSKSKRESVVKTVDYIIKRIDKKQALSHRDIIDIKLDEVARRLLKKEYPVNIRYNENVARFIIAKIVSGVSLDKAIAEFNSKTKTDYLSRGTINYWLFLADNNFAEHYKKTAPLRAFNIDQDIQRIEGEVIDGSIKSSNAKVVISSMRWRAGVENPEVYGKRSEGERSTNINIQINAGEIPVPKQIKEVTIIDDDS